LYTYEYKLLLCLAHTLATQSSEDTLKCFCAFFLLYLALPDIGLDERQHVGETVCNNKVRKLTVSAFRWTYIHNDKNNCTSCCVVTLWMLTRSSLKIFNFAKGLRRVRTPTRLRNDTEGRLRCCRARFKIRRAPHYTFCTLQGVEIGHKGDCTLSYLIHSLHGA